MSGEVPPPLPSSSTMRPLPAPYGSGPGAAKSRYVAAACDLVKRNHAGSDGEGCVTAVVLPLIVLLGLTIVLLPASVWLYRRWRTIRRSDATYREALLFAERAAPVMAFPLMVNSLLRRPGTARAPGLFLVSFEAGKGESIAFMGALAERVGEGNSSGMRYEDYDFCRRLMADEEYRPFRRRRIPPTLTGGAMVYAVDLIISPLLLAGRHISDEMPLVPCMGEGGDNGRVMQMPYWLLDGREPPGDEERQEFEVTLVSIAGMTALARTAAGGAS